MQEQKLSGADVSCIFFYLKDKEELVLKLANQLLDDKRKIHFIKYYSILNLKIIPVLKSHIELIKPDIIHCHLKQAELWISILKFRKKISIPVVTTLHGYRDEYHNKHGLKWNCWTFFSSYYWVTKFINSQIDFFIAISNGVKSFYKASLLVPIHKMKVVHHGINEKNAENISMKKTFQKKLVIVGRLVKFKGHVFAIKALYEILKIHSDTTLHICGTGPEESQLKEITKSLGMEKNIHFHGFIENVNNELKNFDIALIPSIGEPFGIVFLEAFKSGVPIVAFDIPAGNEIIKNGYNGILAKPSDSSDLAKQILFLLENDKIRSSIIKNGQRTLRAEFNIKRMVTDYFKIYDKLVNPDSK